VEDAGSEIADSYGHEVNDSPEDNPIDQIRSSSRKCEAYSHHVPLRDLVHHCNNGQGEQNESGCHHKNSDPGGGGQSGTDTQEAASVLGILQSHCACKEQTVRGSSERCHRKTLCHAVTSHGSDDQSTE